MERSFVATILFALLALAMAFIGNLVLLGLTGSAEHSAGTLAALLACGAAYIAQDRFTRSSYWLNEYEQTPVAPVDRDPWRRHVAAEKWAQFLQGVSASAWLSSVILLWLGLP